MGIFQETSRGRARCKKAKTKCTAPPKDQGPSPETGPREKVLPRTSGSARIARGSIDRVVAHSIHRLCAFHAAPQPPAVAAAVPPEDSQCDEEDRASSPCVRGSQRGEECRAQFLKHG
mgnify:CR=1 FL=1